MGAGMVVLEVPLHILFVTFQAIVRSGHVWPVVSEDVLGRRLQRLTARARLSDGLPGGLANQMAQQFCDEHLECHCSRSSTDTSATMTCWPYAPTPRNS
jgi:hypothetical protein